MARLQFFEFSNNNLLGRIIEKNNMVTLIDIEIEVEFPTAKVIIGKVRLLSKHYKKNPKLLNKVICKTLDSYDYTLNK